ncbi:MAG: hypothetical protein HFF18_13090 [Oscillospiraceae bacterium]|nr:hypothetical protein [Oscillospiraceae bacterium]
MTRPQALADILFGKTDYGADGTKLTGTIPSKSASDLTASGATVAVPAGHYPRAKSAKAPPRPPRRCQASLWRVQPAS